MADSGDQFTHVNGATTILYDGPSQQANSLQGRAFWCRSCNQQVLPRRGRDMLCPECRSEMILVGTSGMLLPHSNGLRYRRRHRVASESDLSRQVVMSPRTAEGTDSHPLIWLLELLRLVILPTTSHHNDTSMSPIGERHVARLGHTLLRVLSGHIADDRLEGRYDDERRMNPSSFSGELMDHDQERSGALAMPATRPPSFGRWAYEINNWEDDSNNSATTLFSDNRYEQDGNQGYLSAGEGSNQFTIRPWGSRSFRGRRNAEPSWQQFMQEMLHNFLGRGVRIASTDVPEHVSDPGDYMDDTPRFDRLLSELAENDPANAGPPPASKSAVEALPSITIKQQHIDDDSATCPVCKERMELDEIAKELPCQHLYHDSCILPWLSFRNSCPVCRFELPTDDADYEARKRAIANNIESVNGQERWGGNGMRVLSAEDGLDVRRTRFHEDYVGEIEEEEETYWPGQSNEGNANEGSANEGSRCGWFWLAARPLLSFVGIVLAFTFGRRLIRAQEPIGNHLIQDQLSNSRQTLDRSN